MSQIYLWFYLIELLSIILSAMFVVLSIFWQFYLWPSIWPFSTLFMCSNFSHYFPTKFQIGPKFDKFASNGFNKRERGGEWSYIFWKEGQKNREEFLFLKEEGIIFLFVGRKKIGRKRRQEKLYSAKNLFRTEELSYKRKYIYS